MPRLTAMQDAYGREIYDYFKGDKEAVEIVERDDGYIDFSSGPRTYFDAYPCWPAYEKKAIRFARGRILDIGCGAGRVLLYLKKKGHDVVGIDNSPLAVKVCKQRGLASVKVMPITQIGPPLGTFDTIVMFGNNFGLFGSYTRAKWLLRKMYRITSPEARIIAATTDPHQTFFPEHLAYHKFNRRRGRMVGQLRLRVRYKKYRTPYFDYLLVSRDEMKDILSGTGWRAAKFIDPVSVPYAAVIEKE